jgi:hypothetical protein
MMLFYATSSWKYSKVAYKASLPESQDDPDTGNPRWGCPETGPSLLLRGPKLEALQRRSVKRRHLLRHVKRLLRCAQGQFTLDAGLHSHSSGLLTHGSG